MGDDEAALHSAPHLEWVRPAPSDGPNRETGFDVAG
jgi:hypothetical protein